MLSIYVHPRALKHGLLEENIVYAWQNFVCKRWRSVPRNDQIIAVGLDSKGTLIEMVATTNHHGLLIYHAIAPPMISMLNNATQSTNYYA